MSKTSHMNHRLNPPAASDIMQASLGQLTKLPAEILRLHQTSQHLVSTGTKEKITHRLYGTTHLTASSSTPATSTLPSTAPSTLPPTSTQATTVWNIRISSSLQPVLCNAFSSGQVPTALSAAPPVQHTLLSQLTPLA